MGAGGKRPSAIPTLDGWRVLALSGVIFCHGIPRHSALAPLRILGPHGVYIFFCISGFLIANNLLREEERNTSIDLRAFYIRRAFRILPPAYAMLGVVATLGTLGVLQPMPLKEWLADAFFLQSYVGRFPGRTEYTTHFWSLAVEQHFYLLFPPLLAVLGSRGFRRLLPLLLLIVPLWRVIDTHFVHLELVFPDIFPRYRSDHCAGFLLWGVTLAFLLREVRAKALLHRALRWPTLLLVSTALMWVLWRKPPFAFTLEGILISLMVAATMLHPESLLSHLLEWRLLKWLGRMSYSVYLWQQLFFVASFRAPAWPQVFPINVVCVLALAMASHQLVELPWLALGRRVLAARSSEGRTAAAAASLQ